MSPLPPDASPPTPDLRLRPSPRPVVRLSRKTITIAGLVAAVAVGGAFALALQPPQAKSVEAKEPTYSTATQPVSDGLSALPKTYGDVPQLGPPLPGDLGKPILDAQNRNAGLGSDMTAPPAYNPTTAVAATPPANDGRTSALFTGTHATITSVDTGAAAPVDAYAALIQAAMTPVSGGSSVSAATSNRPPSLPQDVVSQERLQGPASPYLVLAGTAIPAALTTGLKSDMPGLVTAQVSRDVYDSVRGAYLLVPRGSRLIGEYDTKIAFGQQRVQLVWTRLILPNGKSIVLDREVAADRQGYAGLSDQTDYHWDGVIKAGLLSTTLGIGAQSGASDESDLSRAIRDGASDSLSRTGQRIVERQLNVQPSLTIRPGFPVQVMVSRDLVLEPYGD